jgi:hypothetical protein
MIHETSGKKVFQSLCLLTKASVDLVLTITALFCNSSDLAIDWFSWCGMMEFNMQKFCAFLELNGLDGNSQNDLRRKDKDLQFNSCPFSSHRPISGKDQILLAGTDELCEQNQTTFLGMSSIVATVYFDQSLVSHANGAGNSISSAIRIKYVRPNDQHERVPQDPRGVCSRLIGESVVVLLAVCMYDSFTPSSNDDS